MTIPMGSLMTRTLSEKEARDLAKTIAKEQGNVRIKFGTTNGQLLLHVFVPGHNEHGRVVSCTADWEDHPANERARRNDRFATETNTDRLMEQNRPETHRA